MVASGMELRREWEIEMIDTKDRPGTGPTKALELSLVGHDGNAFAIIGSLRRELRRAGADATYIAAVTADATSGDYDHLIQVALAEIEAFDEPGYSGEVAP